MRSIQPTRRRSSASLWFGMVLVTAILGGGLIGVLALMGVNLNPFASAVEDPFMVRIPINSRPIPAYERVVREHLLNPATGGLMYQRVPPSAAVGMAITGLAADGSPIEGRVENVRNVNDQVVFVVADGREVPQAQALTLGGALMNVNAIIGRVVKKDKRAGMGFREDTFFPQGTPEGVAGATPPGMRAVTLDATKLTGVHALNAGDRIDLMASVPTGEAASFTPSANNRLPGADLVRQASDSAGDAVTEPLLLAQGAVVIKPVYVRNEATTSASLTQGKRVQNVPKYEVAIAVNPDDVLPLQSALGKSLAITCIAHSMQPSDTSHDSGTTDSTTPSTGVAPVTIRAIAAYDVVSREAFVSVATRQVRMERVSPREAERMGIITSLDEALGTVVRHDIPAGSFLRRSDLLSGAVKRPSRPARKSPTSDASERRAAAERLAPQSQYEEFAREPRSRQLASIARSTPASDHTTRDTRFRFASDTNRAIGFQGDADDPAGAVVGDRPAVARFVPPGYKALAVPWNRLYGAEHLQIGDAVDLLASFSLERSGQTDETETRADGTKILRQRNDLASRTTLRTWEESLGARGESWYVASDAVVVGPVGFPAPASARRALGDSARSAANSNSGATTLTGPALILAVEERDVETLASALATRDVLFTPAIHSLDESAESDDGAKRIALAAHDIEAFEALTENTWLGNRRHPVSRIVAADDPRYERALTIDELVDYQYRVLRRAKRRGEFFTATDFLPEGATPGVTAAVAEGFTLLAVADREFDGLDTFQSGDAVAILMRRVESPPDGAVVHDVPPAWPTATVIVPSARIVRASRGGQTVLEVDNRFLTRLQAARADSTDTADGSERRSRLAAVGLPRDVEPDADSPLPPQNTDAHAAPDAMPSQNVPAERRTATSSHAIPDFNPIGRLRRLEAIIGDQRQWHVFTSPPPDETDLSDQRGGR